jgi:hypothetical protein
MMTVKLVQAWFKGKCKGKGSPDNDRTSPVTSKPRNNNGFGFEALFRASTTLAQDLAHEQKERFIAEIILLEQQQHLQGHYLITPEVKEDESPATEHMDQILADCCETLGISFALSLTGAEDLEDCDESFLKTESWMLILTRVARRHTCA